MVLFYVFIFIVIIILLSIKIIKEYERGVVFTLGRYSGMRKPGLRFVVPIIQTWRRIDIRIHAVDIPSQECVSKDNVSLKVNAVLFYKVMNAAKAVLEVESFMFATSQLAQTTMRNIIGEFELDEILQKREDISKTIKKIVDDLTDPWGIEVTNIEIKDIELPDAMKRAMARQAESERDRRARVILAKGEAQAAANLAAAGKTIGAEPAALQLRLFQTMSDVSAEKNSTLVIPFPMELMDYFLEHKKKK